MRQRRIGRLETHGAAGAARTVLAALVLLFAAAPAAAQLTVSVVDDSHVPVTNGFRWTLEEDNSYAVRKTAPDGPWAGPAGGAIQYPGTPSPNAAWVPGGINESYTLGVNIHHSHAPTVCTGDTALPMPPPANPTDPPLQPQGYAGAPSSVVISAANCPGYAATKNYMVSVLPWHSSAPGTPPNAQTGWSMSGRNVAAGQTTTTVVVHAFPQPTGQITALVFEDNQSINGAYDQPAEHGLSNFQFLVNDPAGQLLQDAWTNPVGTTYKYKCARTVVQGGVSFSQPLDCATSQPLAQGLQPEFQYDPVTNLPVVDFLGDGTVYTCPGGTNFSAWTPYQRANCVDPYTLAPMAIGEAVVRFLPQNKYTLEPVPPANGVACGDTANSKACSDMLLTATLEGTRGNDAWIRAGEPRYNITLGQLNYLVFYGFVHPMNGLSKLPGQHTGTIQGQIVYTHDPHPPLSPGLLSNGPPVRSAYVGLNNLSGNDEQVYTAAADPVTGKFQITGVPPGTYQIAVWDKPINMIIDYRTVTVGAGKTVDLGYSNSDAIAVFGWFGTLNGSVFYDANGDGHRDSPSTEPGLSSFPVNVRYTDGSTWGSTTTDSTGSFSFNQYFAWWRFLIAEVDSSRLKSTGVTSVVDNGGPLTDASVFSGTGQSFSLMGIRPQIQACDAGNAGCTTFDGGRSRTERSNAGLNDGVVTTQAVELFQDMTARFDFGKASWGASENGGIKGKVNYATTRTGEDPRYDVEDGWEPGVPRVKVQLWRAKNDPSNPQAATNGGWVKDTADGTANGPLVPIYQTTSSSWDDAQPTNCVAAQGTGLPGQYVTQPEVVNGFAIPSCAETFHVWDQTRPGIYDGQYRFDRYCASGYDVAAGACLSGTPTMTVPPGNYIVQVVKPQGYEIEDWGTRNIEFGDPKSVFLTVPPPCVGDPYPVPQYHTLFPDQQVPTDTTKGGYGAWTAGMQLASCDQKAITLNPGANYTADFHIFTSVPKAARIWGTVWDDLTLEFNPLSPNASGNLGASYLPVAVKDWKGTEVARFYTDQWGHFDGLVPANYDIAPPIPLGLVLQMHTIAPNDPGPILDTRLGSPTNGQWITDPFFNPAYSQEVIRENWEFYPGHTAFIDTIVIPLAGFVANRVPLNCSVDTQPELMKVGEAGETDVIIRPGGKQITLTSMGIVTGPNPNYDPSNPVSPSQVPFNHGFGPGPTVSVNGIPLPGAVYGLPNAQGIDTISVFVPDSVFAGTNTGQLVVTSANGKSTTAGITLHYNPSRVLHVSSPPASCVDLACGVIQPAIDAALPGTVIVLHPGTNYQENVNLWKPVTLQGLGAPVTVLDGTRAIGNFALKQKQFNQLQALENAGAIGLVPNQASDFTLEQGAGILVAGCTSPCANSFTAPGAVAQIDGLTITGASEAGGGVLVNGYAGNLRITNNEIVANQGSLGGGVRVGEPNLIGAGNPTGSSFNPDVRIDHNRIAQNGSFQSGGGGVALYGGSDGYQVTNNFVCGNLSAGYGGGIGHFGLVAASPTTHSVPVIQGNTILNNESVDEGAGIHIGGENPVAGTLLTIGSGSVVLNANLIQGNKAGDDGGGIRLRRINGTDVSSNPSDASKWHQIDIFNNMIVNNSSADHGGGISLDDAVKVNIASNTIARNDATSSGSGAFGGPCTETSPVSAYCPTSEAIGGLSNSDPQVAGIASFAHSAELTTALAASSTVYRTQTFSNPVLVDDILWQNRTFYWDATANGGLGALLPRPGPDAPYWDLGVYGFTPPAPTMSPTYSALTDGVGATPFVNNKIGVDPGFLGGCALGTGTGGQPTGPVASGAGSCFNVYQASQAGAALGNFVTVIFTPTGVQGDYHIPPTSLMVDQGTTTNTFGLQVADFDGQPRPRGNATDIGADETDGSATPPPPPPPPPPPAGPQFPTLAVLDNFNRNNANNLNTGVPAGVAWSQATLFGVGALQVDTAQVFAAAPALGVAYWNGPGNVFGAKQAAAFTFANTVLNGSAVTLKGSLGTPAALARYVRVRYSTGTGGQTVVETTTNAFTFTTRGVLAGAFASGDTLTAQVDAAGLLAVWKTHAATTTLVGTVQLPTTGANSWTTGSGRIGIQLPSMGARADNFAGGTVP